MVFCANSSHVFHANAEPDCSLLCLPIPSSPRQCCVFPAAVVLLDSWEILLRNLWDEHLNHSLIRDIKQTLDQIIRRNKYAGVGFSFPECYHESSC